MDGTLTQTNQLIFESFNHIAEKYINKRLTPKEIVALFGPPEEEAVENMIGSQHIDSAMNEYHIIFIRIVITTWRRCIQALKSCWNL